MEWYWELIISVVLIALALVVILVIIPFLKKKGLLSEEVLTAIESVLGLLPGTSTVSKIKEIAQIAVDYAEQMNKTGEIEADARKQAALDLAKQLLEEAGIELTEKTEKIVDAVIEACVNALGHTTKTE